MRRHAVAILLGLSWLTLSGCYEGWDNTQGSGAQLPTLPPTVPAANKVYGYILFEPISMGSDATASTACMPNVGIVQYKTTEWSDRISAITSALNGISDDVVVNALTISATDCTTLAAVQVSALDASPWGTSPAPTTVSSGKPLMQLKAAFWEGEPSLSPPMTVTSRDWSAWAQLKAGGLNAFSLHYFVVSNPVNGYFTQWDTAEAGSTLDGTPINSVDPTAAGVTTRTQTINTDTQSLVTWLTAQGSGT